MRAAFAVKEGKGVNVSEKRREELTQQFFSGKEQPATGIDLSLKEDVGLWTDLAWGVEFYSNRIGEYDTVWPV